MPAGDHVIDMPLVSELPGWPQHNTMLAHRLADGGVMIRPHGEPGIPRRPTLVVQPTADASRVRYTLNDRVLDMQSPLADLYLAMELVEMLHASS
jgi:hypothetical protein